MLSEGQRNRGNEMNLLISKQAAAIFGVDRRIQGNGFRDLQMAWCKLRDESGCGVSEIGNGGNVLNDNGKRIAKISYNGRVWE